ncbi:MAG: hypothetical protein GY772_01745, partial [bacterium]|nr:hypothetical protein [bacterium]
MADAAQPAAAAALSAARGPPAALVCLFTVGSPRSELLEGRSCDDWADHAFGPAKPRLAGLRLALPVERQQREFVTALTSRAGGNALLKPLTALHPDVQDKSTGTPSGQVRMSLRTIAPPAAWDRRVAVGHGPHASWLVVPLKEPLDTGVVCRREVQRSHPDEMRNIFRSAADAHAVQAACTTVLTDLMATAEVDARAASGEKRARNRAYQRRIALEMLQRL